MNSKWKVPQKKGSPVKTMQPFQKTKTLWAYQLETLWCFCYRYTIVDQAKVESFSRLFVFLKQLYTLILSSRKLLCFRAFRSDLDRSCPVHSRALRSRSVDQAKVESLSRLLVFFGFLGTVAHFDRINSKSFVFFEQLHSFDRWALCFFGTSHLIFMFSYVTGFTFLGPPMWKSCFW